MAGIVAAILASTPAHAVRAPALTSDFAIFQHEHAVHEDVLHADRKRRSAAKMSPCRSASIIEHDDVGGETLGDSAAVVGQHGVRRSGAGLGDGPLQRNRAQLADVAARAAAGTSRTPAGARRSASRRRGRRRCRTR